MFHIGKLIRDVAVRKGIPATALAAALEPPRYLGNESKMFKVADMMMADLVRLSAVLNFNIPALISAAFLDRIPFTGSDVMQACDAVTFDLFT